MYYFCRQNLFESNGYIEIVGHSEETGKHRWTHGHRIIDSIAEQVLILDPSYGENLPDFFDTTVPVMSDSLLERLKELGVSNFDTYPVVLKRQDNDEEFRGYKIVNFIGCLDAIDYEKTKMNPKRLKHRGSIHIDDSVVGDQKAFRLAKGTTLLVVNEDIAKSLIADVFKGLMLQPTNEYTGR